MVLLRSTICLLLIIAFPEAASITCGSECVAVTTKEGDDVKFWCQTPSGSDGAPVLTWDLSPIGSEQPEVPDQVDDGGTSSRDFTWQVVAPVPLLVCSAQDPSGQVETCETKTCDIPYSPRNVVTSPLYSVSPGENITCTADGNPEPTFKWQENVDGSWTDVDGADGETITAELKDGATYTELRCVAMNGDSENSVSASVYVSKYGSSIRTVIIICVVVGVVVVGVISAVIYKVKGGKE